MDEKPSVHYWTYSDGSRKMARRVNGDIEMSVEHDESLKGWHCYVHNAGVDFEKWMNKNMKGKHETIFRFNSGNPAYTVHIKDAEDAAFFKLTWL